MSNVTPREAVDGSGASSTFNGQTGNSLAREPPVVSGGARASQHEDADDFGVRRSQRAWKPSQGCLANIAHVQGCLAGGRGDGPDVITS